MDEPTKLYSVVRDRDGELWMRGRKWWYWQPRRRSEGDGPGKLRWSSLEKDYGPLGVDAETERIAAKGILGGRARD
jgi:hypothetical protein